MIKNSRILITFIFLSFFLIITLFGCVSGLPDVPNDNNGTFDENDIANENSDEGTGAKRVLLIELFNTEGCAASKVVNPIIEEIVSEYDQFEVILVEEAGWGIHATSETNKRFKWYFEDESKLHTPAVCFNGLNQLYAQQSGLGGGGGSSSGSQPVNYAPRIISSPVNIATIDLAYQYQVEATDEDHDQLSYSLLSKPEGMIIDQETGLISWTPVLEEVGEREIKVGVSDGKKIATQSYTLHVHNVLLSICALPEMMELFAGQSKTIEKVTASYQGDSSWDIEPLNSCEFSVVDGGESIISVDSEGKVTGLSEGVATLQIAYTEGGVSCDDEISITVSENSPSYRLLAVGVGKYLNSEVNDLTAPPLDVARIVQTLGQASFSMEVTETLTDESATKTAILAGIANTFSQADSNDVSYFYFSGHGSALDNQYYLCPHDVNTTSTAISVDELEEALSAIAGTKVVLLDCCRSGGFIGKDAGLDSLIQAEQFNQGIIMAFSQSIARDNLAQSEYQVLTACSQNQFSYEIPYPTTGDAYGVFSKVFCDGIGYNGDYPADADEPLDQQVSLQEAYDYTSEQITSSYEYLPTNQDTQIYPLDSTFPVMIY